MTSSEIVGFENTLPTLEYPFVSGDAVLRIGEELYSNRGKTDHTSSDLGALSSTGFLSVIDPIDMPDSPSVPYFLMALHNESRWYGLVSDEYADGIIKVTHKYPHTFYVFNDREKLDEYSYKSCNLILGKIALRRSLSVDDMCDIGVCLSLNTRSIWTHAFRCFVLGTDSSIRVAEALLKKSTPDFDMTLAYIRANYTLA